MKILIGLPATLCLTFLFTTLVQFVTMRAQMLDGIYHLSGMHEMAGGFRFTPDGRFDFYYSYGAVDRQATGSYSVEGDTIKLKSDKEAGRDFPLISEAKKGKGYMIEISAPDPYLRSYVRAICIAGESKEVFESNDKGMIEISEGPWEEIYLQHQLYPDIASLIKGKDNTHNYFKVSLAPELALVSFKGIDLFIDGDTLTCLPNYFLPYEKIRFVKE